MDTKTTGTMAARIAALKKEQDAVILAHYYVKDSAQEVADYIVKEGLQSDLMITTPFDLPLITTFGPYIDKINDYEYREKLLEVLIPKQLEMEQGMGSDEDYGMKVT